MNLGVLDHLLSDLIQILSGFKAQIAPLLDLPGKHLDSIPGKVESERKDENRTVVEETQSSSITGKGEE